MSKLFLLVLDNTHSQKPIDTPGSAPLRHPTDTLTVSFEPVISHVVARLYRLKSQSLRSGCHVWDGIEPPPLGKGPDGFIDWLARPIALESDWNRSYSLA